MATPATNEETKDETKPDSSDETNKIDFITVGRLVEVASRTWPGINKPGGVAKVVEVHFDDDDKTNDEGNTGKSPKRRNPTHVNVRYMVGSSREKRVPIEYVKLAPQYETNTTNREPSASSGQSERCTYVASSLRDRSMLLGRCKRCGSLRTDCGSCDWAMEEETASASHQKATTTSASKKSKPKTRNKNNKNHRTGDSLLLEDDSDESSNDSSDENDELDLSRLRRLIQRSKKQSLEIKRYSSRSKSRGRWRRKYPLLIDDLTSSSESETEEASERNLGRKKGRMLTGGQSILESLPAIRERDKKNNKQRKRKKLSSKSTSLSVLSGEASIKRSKSLEVPSSSDSEMDDIPLTSVFGSIENNQSSASKRIRSGEALAEIPLNAASNIRRAMNDTEAQEETYNRQLLELEARARFQMKKEQNRKDTKDGNDVDAGFIQPEGQEAVENLPDDIVDLSRNVPYKDLGPLFDSMATKIEDEFLPDFKLQMAGLHQKLKILQKQQQRATLNTENNAVSPKLLLEEYHLLWEDVRSSMVQNGTDQCRATLRRLMDDKLYRKHRKQLTKEERKRCRGPGVIDARNLRMDAMDDAVESFIRKLKEAVVACEKACEEISQIDSDNEDEEENDMSADVYYDDDVSSEDENLNSPHITTNDQTEKTLAPFQLHEHSSRARKENPEHATIGSRKSTSKPGSSKNSHLPRRKRPRTSNATNDITRHSKSKDASGAAGKVNTNVVNIGEDLPSINESHTVLFDAEDSSMDPVEEEINDDANSSRHRTVNHVEGKRKRKVSQTEIRIGLSEPRDSKQSISERMQAFLDANEANGVRVCSDDEEIEAAPNARRRYKNIHGSRRRNYSIFEPKSKQKNVQNDRVQYDDRIGNAVQEEDEVEREESRSNDFDTQSLFDQLSNRSPLSEDSASLVFNDEDSSNFDKNWDGLLSEMKIALSRNPESMNAFLERSYSLLISRGSRTLQDLIASNEIELSLHIRTLSLCVSSLKYVSDDQIPIVFAKETQKNFLDFLVLQLVDALYSLTLPSAWALESEGRERTFRQLIPLRDALASCIPLVEAVSECIIKSLECQQWRKTPNKNHVFVSSLDPQRWRKFLETGTKFDNPQGK